jgi:ABC-2 type transport system ATP-binding protein
LILDEPAANLDPQGRRDVLEVMTRIRKYATIFYGTHILDDVQRVSDQVAIVNQGELVTQASIEELLGGTGDLVYTVSLKGDGQNAYTQVNQQSWISRIEVNHEGEQTTWQVSVTDEAAAEDQLMSLLVSNGLKVSNFGRKAQNLEDVFINIIERSQK